LILEFTLAAILVELTPGPNMTWLAVVGTSRGRSTALFAVAGIALGLAVAALIAGTSLAAIFATMPKLFDVLRWLGTLYLFYLAWDSWKDASTQTGPSAGTARQAFGQGLLSNILNPKAYVFYLAVLPRFIDKTAEVPAQLLLLSAIYVAVATFIHTGIALISGSAADWLVSSPQAIATRRILAVCIALAAIWFFLSTGDLK
jgi:threonine/homoserine/homoserine lactone efflux protein